MGSEGAVVGVVTRDGMRMFLCYGEPLDWPSRVQQSFQKLEKLPVRTLVEDDPGWSRYERVLKDASTPFR